MTTTGKLAWELNVNADSENPSTTNIQDHVLINRDASFLKSIRVGFIHVCLSLSTNYTSSCKPFILHDVLSTKFDTNYSNSVSIAVWYNDSWNTPIQMDHQKRTGKTKLKSFPPLWMYLRTFFFTIPRFVPNLSLLSSIQWQSHKDQKMLASSLHGSKRLQQLENGDPAITNSGQFDTSLMNKSRKLKS